MPVMFLLAFIARSA